MAVADNLEQSRAALTMIHGMPYNAEAPSEALVGDITPTELHYVRSNFAVPTHDGTLEIGGAVANPTTITLEELRAMPAVERAVTLECAGNGRLAMRPLPTGEPWGDYAVSTARWTGAPLKHSSSLARPAADGVEVLFRGRRSRAVPPQRDPRRHRSAGPDVRARPAARSCGRPAAEILIAYEMNGEPLGPDHGAPFRLIVPHWYAVASVKWLKRIDVLTEPYTGEFQTGHYIYEWAEQAARDASTIMRVRARITDPAPGAVIPAGTYTVRGKAWSGSGPVTRVDVSLTGAGDWYPAEVEPPKGPTSGRTGRSSGTAEGTGRKTLRARATDAAGNVQPEMPPWNRLGYGNNAVEIVYVDVP